MDFRDWNVGRLANQQDRLPSIPEALTRPRFPSAVSYTHHLLCAFGALVFHFFNTRRLYTTQLQPLDQAGTSLFKLIVDAVVILRTWSFRTLPLDYSSQKVDEKDAFGSAVLWLCWNMFLAHESCSLMEATGISERRVQ